MQYIERLIQIALLLLVMTACIGEQESGNGQDYFIEWDETSLLRIAEEGGYPRLRQLDDGSLLIVYENWQGGVVARRSMDEGVTWSDAVMAFDRFEYVDSLSSNSTFVNIANPEIIQLGNGDILLATNLRPRKQGVYPYSIALQRSVDFGENWSDATVLYQAASFFKDGCWEPSFLLLPDETVHIYFANESPYRDSDEQEISVLISNDNGHSWGTDPMTVSFREGFRDGMPVAIHDGSNLYMAIEDNISGQFKPYIVKSEVDNPWNVPVYADSPDRYSALLNPLPDTVYAGAPYLIRTDSDIYLLSYQTTENRNPNWEQSVMEVQISDTPSRFRNPSRPFNIPLNKEAKWNSLADLGNNTIAALASTDIEGDKIGVWMIKGTIKLREGKDSAR